MPLAGLGDRLVTEGLPLLDKSEEGFVHYFCTTLFAPTAPLSQAKVPLSLYTHIANSS
jgi:hypothetical protein